jgi:Arc/MetJ-type ribon-helix-helix transcriptional regulator
MVYQFPPDVEQNIQFHLASSEYESEADVLRHSLELLDRRRDDIESIDRGVADIEAVRYRSADESEAEFEKNHNFRPN